MKENKLKKQTPLPENNTNKTELLLSSNSTQTPIHINNKHLHNKPEATRPSTIIPTPHQPHYHERYTDPITTQGNGLMLHNRRDLKPVSRG